MTAVPLVDDSFWLPFVQDTLAWGADPRVVAQVMYSESAFDPEAINPAQRDANGRAIGGRPNIPAGDPGKACIGLNQLCPVNHHLFAPLDVLAYQKLSASEQWRAGAGKFFEAQLRAHPEAGRDVAALYWLNYRPATYVKNAPDDFVIIASDPDNQGLQDAGTHAVTPATLRAFATRDAGSAKWKQILAAIDAAERGVPLAQGVTPPPKPSLPSTPRPSPSAAAGVASADAGPIAFLAVLGFLGWRLARRKG